jgi:glycosyltransferase involved in cell wall biosynthesis
VGGEGVSYGVEPKGGGTWKQRLTEEIAPAMTPEDWQRVHFLGQIPYAAFRALMQVSTVHTYLTYPFVLSWSLLEAMSMQCAIVASDTPPLREVIRHNENGVLVPFFNRDALVEQIVDLLKSPDRRCAFGDAARKQTVERYDLQSICLPRQLQWVDSLLNA